MHSRLHVEIMPLRPSRWPGPRRTLVSAHQRHYLTDDPAAERTYTASATIGENEGQRFSMRVDTGSLFGRDTRAWIAAVRQEATDWVEGSARNEREHVAAKLVSSHGRLDLTSYFSYDSIHEDVYQRLYSDADFRANPRWDRLVGEPSFVRTALRCRISWHRIRRPTSMLRCAA